MKKFWEKVEHYNRKLILFALIILLVIIFVELSGKVEDPVTRLVFQIMDYIVVVIFAIDLVFLAIKAKTVSFFFKNYWLDLLAVFPFGLLFELVSRFYRGAVLAEELVIGQKVVHETIEGEKEVRGITYMAKEGRLARGVRIFTRSLRAVAKSRLFTRFERKRKEAHRKVYGKKR